MASSHIRRAKAQQIMPEPYGLYRALQPSHPRPNTRHVHGHRMTHGDTYCTCRCDTCTSHAHARHTRRTWSAGCSLGSGTPASASRQPRMVNGMTGPKAKDMVECQTLVRVNYSPSVLSHAAAGSSSAAAASTSEAAPPGSVDTDGALAAVPADLTDDVADACVVCFENERTHLVYPCRLWPPVPVQGVR